MDSTLKVEVTHLPGIAIVTLAGEARLQLRSLEVEITRLSAERVGAVILDMAGISLVSSLGMGLLVSLRNGLKRREGRLLAVGIQPLVLESFQRSHLDNIFELFDTLDAAVASANAGLPLTGHG